MFQFEIAILYKKFVDEFFLTIKTEMRTYVYMMKKNRNLVYCAMFTAMIAVGAFIRVPIPVVPFTLQVFFTMMAGSLLGSRLGATSAVSYMVLGLVGLPIFTAGGGFWYVFKPSFGYIIGFCFGTYVTGLIVESAEKAKKLSVKTYIIANFSGLAIIYIMGMIYYYVICNFVIDTPIALWPLVLHCFLLTIPGDICLGILASFLAKRIRPLLNLNQAVGAKAKA